MSNIIINEQIYRDIADAIRRANNVGFITPSNMARYIIQVPPNDVELSEDGTTMTIRNNNCLKGYMIYNDQTIEHIIVDIGTAQAKKNEIFSNSGIKQAELLSGKISSNECFSYCLSLKKVWISNNVTFNANTTSSKLFSGCDRTCEIYTDATSRPSNWSSYFNYYSSSGQLTVHYGATYQDYLDA